MKHAVGRHAGAASHFDHGIANLAGGTGSYLLNKGSIRIGRK
jgi:hypothetical protein